MSGLSSLDAVYIAMVFLVPGYVYFVVRGHLVPGHRSRGTESIIKLLSASTVNFSLWAWAVYLVIEIKNMPIWARPAIWTFSILISPAIMGLLSGLCTKKDMLGRMYRRFGFNSIHITPTSWDYAFSNPEPRFIIVSLNDGAKFAGFWGEQSFASDEPLERDIYIEEVYKLRKENEEWLKTDRSVLIKGECIRSIEFVRD